MRATTGSTRRRFAEAGSWASWSSTRSYTAPRYIVVHRARRAIQSPSEGPRHTGVSCFFLHTTLTHPLHTTLTHPLTPQVSLYSLLFVPRVDQALLATVLYACLAALNLGLPLLWLVGFVFQTVRFAGYPFVSARARARLHALVHLSVVWTAARLCWGMVALTTVLQGWLARAQASQSHYAAVLVAVFLVSEVGLTALALPCLALPCRARSHRCCAPAHTSFRLSSPHSPITLTTPHTPITTYFSPHTRRWGPSCTACSRP